MHIADNLVIIILYSYIGAYGKVVFLLALFVKDLTDIYCRVLQLIVYLFL